MGTNETNLHRAARALQRSEGITYQQARQRILDARATPVPADHPGLAPDDDGERRCTDCGDSFNLAEGGTDLLDETGDDDGLCIMCEAADPPAAPIPVAEVWVGFRLDDLSPASCAGSGTVVATCVDGNPNLVRVALDGGGELRVDIRRFAGSVPAPLTDPDADARVADATTEEAGDLAFLLALATEVVVLRTRAGTWQLHCVTDPDTANVAVVDAAVSRRQLEAWLNAHCGVPVTFAG